MNLTIKKHPFAYVIGSNREGGYGKCIIRLMQQERSYDTGGAYTELVSLQWQSNAESMHDWYGLHVAVDLPGYDGEVIARMGQATTLVKKLLADEGRDWSPRVMVERLASLKIPRVAYDGRLSKYLTPDETPDAALVRYVDDYNRYTAGDGWTGCRVSALARDEDEAKHYLAKEYGSLVAKSPSYASALSNWVQAGSPVLSCSRGYSADRAAEFPTIDALLFTPPAPEPMAEAA